MLTANTQNTRAADLPVPDSLSSGMTLTSWSDPGHPSPEGWDPVSYCGEGKRSQTVGELELQYISDFTGRTLAYCTKGGSREFVIASPDLYDLLLRQIPKENILMNKKVLSFLQGENGVMIRCSDDSTYEGDILVGANGAYSTVRQHLYSVLKKETRLPDSDGKPLPFKCVRS